MHPAWRQILDDYLDEVARDRSVRNGPGRKVKAETTLAAPDVERLTGLSRLVYELVEVQHLTQREALEVLSRRGFNFHRSHLARMLKAARLQAMRRTSREWGAEQIGLGVMRCPEYRDDIPIVLDNRGIFHAPDRSMDEVLRVCRGARRDTTTLTMSIAQ
jgi:hypothetical protein